MREGSQPEMPVRQRSAEVSSGTVEPVRRTGEEENAYTVFFFERLRVYALRTSQAAGRIVGLRVRGLGQRYQLVPAKYHTCLFSCSGGHFHG